MVQKYKNVIILLHKKYLKCKLSNFTGRIKMRDNLVEIIFKKWFNYKTVSLSELILGLLI